MRKRLDNRGFTLVELIVVITIIAILAAILVPTVGRYIEDANRTRIMANARNVYTACSVVAANDMAKNLMNSNYQGIVDFSEESIDNLVKEYVTYTGKIVATSDADGKIIKFTYTEGGYTFGLVNPYGNNPDFSFDPNPKTLPG